MDECFQTTGVFLCDAQHRIQKFFIYAVQYPHLFKQRLVVNTFPGLLNGLFRLRQHEVIGQQIIRQYGLIGHPQRGFQQRCRCAAAILAHGTVPEYCTLFLRQQLFKKPAVHGDAVVVQKDFVKLPHPLESLSLHLFGHGDHTPYGVILRHGLPGHTFSLIFKDGQVDVRHPR